MNKYFGTDGVRGSYGSAIMNESFAQKFGLAIGAFLIRKSGSNPQVLIGRDTRPSGASLKNSLIKGLLATGCRVLDSGIVPSPALAFGVLHYRADFGVMITASHNPYHDNGIKCFSQKGTKLLPECEILIEQLIDQQPEHCSPKGGAESVDLIDNYCSHFNTLFPKNGLKGLNIALDLANGATSETTPRILKSMGATVFCSHFGDGLINDNCGSEYLTSLQSMVRLKDADLGIAHDGDGDRVRFVDPMGNIVDGDQVLGLLALHAHQSNQLDNATFVSTVHSNTGLKRSLNKRGISLATADVGDRNVFLKMLELKTNWGGESSGHIIGTDYLPTGDGLIAALMILGAIQQNKRSIRQLADEILLWPAISKAFPIRDKIPFNQIPHLCETLMSEESKVGEDGRILLRYSGTEAKVRLLVEGEQKDWVQESFKKIQEILEKSL